jgi:hypothetical protein
MKYPIREQTNPCKARDELERTLDRYAAKVVAFLDLAVSLANVVVVTLARRPWVTTSSTNFLPHIEEALIRHKIEVVYVKEKIPEDMHREDVAEMFKTSQEERDFWMRGKAVAMKGAIETFYAKSNGSWKNLISLGDSNFERLALQKVGADYVETVPQAANQLKVKTFKMLEDPSLDMMVAEIALLSTWLPDIVRRDGALDLQIAEADDNDGINAMNHFLTGRHDELTWLALAGLDADDGDSGVLA